MKRAEKPSNPGSLIALRLALAGAAQDVEKGFMTPRQWAKEWGKSEEYSRKILSQGVTAEKVECKTFRIMTGRGIYPVPHYKVLV